MSPALAGGFFIYVFILFIYFWLCWVFVAARGLSLVAASEGHSPLQCAGLSLPWPLLLQSTGSRRADFSSCGMWAQQPWLMGSRVQAQQKHGPGIVDLKAGDRKSTRLNSSH